MRSTMCSSMLLSLPAGILATCCLYAQDAPPGTTPAAAPDDPIQTPIARLDLNAAQTTLGAVSRLAGAKLKPAN